MTTVLIADNHPLMRGAVRSVLDAEPDFEVVGEVGDAESCLLQLEISVPDIVVLDLNMPGKGGFHVLEEIRTRPISTATFILSMYSGREFVTRAEKLGARGFIAKEDVGQELLSVLRSTATGFVMSSSAGTASAEEMQFSANANQSIEQALELLTYSERRVLRLLADANSSADISDALGISLRTVHTHRQNIRQKLGLSGANALVVFAAKHQASILANQM